MERQCWHRGLGRVEAAGGPCGSWEGKERLPGTDDVGAGLRGDGSFFPGI